MGGTGLPVRCHHRSRCRYLRALVEDFGNPVHRCEPMLCGDGPTCNIVREESPAHLGLADPIPEVYRKRASQWRTPDPLRNVYTEIERALVSNRRVVLKAAKFSRLSNVRCSPCSIAPMEGLDRIITFEAGVILGFRPVLLFFARKFNVPGINGDRRTNQRPRIVLGGRGIMAYL